MNWSPLAIYRLSEAAKYIALDNPVAAERWVNKIFDQVEKLSEFPERGRVVPEVGDKTIREIISGNHRIIYRLKDREISILTLRHVKQELSIEMLLK
ncbi:MAG: type II toxin-antitoxin system RelE/ParE family toxin [Xanthomonadales bacterium]|nr:type II toxin-antitoxin system RelE/ParE family toxin [Xanthomonadales bacterium]